MWRPHCSEEKPYWGSTAAKSVSKVNFDVTVVTAENDGEMETETEIETEKYFKADELIKGVNR